MSAGGRISAADWTSSSLLNRSRKLRVWIGAPSSASHTDRSSVSV